MGGFLIHDYKQNKYVNLQTEIEARAQFVGFKDKGVGQRVTNLRRIHVAPLGCAACAA